MGRGDKKTKKGKIFSGSFGVLRPHKLRNKKSAGKHTKLKAPPKSAPVAKKEPTIAEPVTTPEVEAEVKVEAVEKEVAVEETPEVVAEETPEVVAEEETTDAAEEESKEEDKTDSADEKPASKD